MQALSPPEPGRALAQPAQRARLATALSPARKRALQPLAIVHDGEQLDAWLTFDGGTQSREVELAGVADPGRAVQRSLTVLCVLVALQGAVGLDQYETHLPAELVWVHVGLACGAWLAAVWATCAAGRLEPRGSRISADRRLKGDLGAPTPVKFPGN